MRFPCVEHHEVSFGPFLQPVPRVIRMAALPSHAAITFPRFMSSANLFEGML